MELPLVADAAVVAPARGPCGRRAGTLIGLPVGWPVAGLRCGRPLMMMMSAGLAARNRAKVQYASSARWLGTFAIEPATEAGPRAVGPGCANAAGAASQEPASTAGAASATAKARRPTGDTEPVFFRRLGPSLQTRLMIRLVNMVVVPFPDWMGSAAVLAGVPAGLLRLSRPSPTGVA